MEKQKNEPALRFPEFSGDWERKTLGEVINNKSGKYNPEREIESFKCIELEHLASETGQLLGFVDSAYSGSIKNRFETGDVLFGKLRPYLKKYLQAPFNGVCSSEIWVLKGKSIANDFLYRIVQTDYFIDLANQSTGSKMPRADWDVVSSGIFPIPSLTEQQKIASFFTAVDDKLTQLKKKKSLLEQYKKGVMQNIFSQEIRFKDEDGKEFPKWDKKKLGEVCEIIGGGTPETNNKEYWNGNIQWFTPTEIKSDFVSKSYRNITELGLKKSSAKILPMGAILLTTRATIGEVSIALEECTTNQGFQSLIVKEKNHNIFIFNWIKENKFEFVKRANGSTFAEISKSAIEQINILIPCFAEQIKIAHFLSAIDEKINHCHAQIEKSEQWKKGLLQKMFV